MPNAASISRLLSRIAPIVLITALGFALRAATLTHQSYWVDEYQYLTPWRTFNLTAHLAYLRFVGPDHIPLYLIIHNAWRALVSSDSIFLTRFLSVLMGTACIPFLYVMTKSLFDVRAAIIASLCLALSPFHIDIAQGIRPNVLTDLLSIISMYGLQNAIKTNSRSAWILNSAANLGIMWTHIMGGLLIAAEGCALLPLLLTRRKSVISWIVVSALSIASTCIWLFAIHPTVPDAKEDFFMNMPSAKALAADTFADDALMTNDPFVFQGETWKFLPIQIQRTIVSLAPQIDTSMIIFFAVCLAWLAYGLHSSALALFREKTKEKHVYEIATKTLLLATVFIPIIALVVLAVVFRPTVLPRYTTFSSFACYAAAGVAISSIPFSKHRAAAIAFLLALYGYQLSLSLPATKRTNWRGVKNVIERDLSPDDVIMVKGTYFSEEVLHLNWPTDYPRNVIPTATFEAIAENSSRLFANPSHQRKVWAVIEPFIYHFPPLASLEKSLTDRGLRFQRTDLQGMNGVSIYRIERDPALPIATNIPPIETTVDYDAILSDLGYKQTDQEARRTLRLMIDADFPRSRMYYTILALSCLDAGYVEMAENASKLAVTLDPRYHLANLILSETYGLKGDSAAAQKAFQKTLEVDESGYVDYFQKLFEAWDRDHNEIAAREECLRLFNQGFYLPYNFRLRAGLAKLPPEITPHR